MQVLSVSQLTPRPLVWLWPKRLLEGKLAILDGDPGLGKSLVTLDLCARLSTGRPFPDGSPSFGPVNSLVLNSEDGAEDTIRPRLQALGADLERVFVPHAGDAGLAEPLRIPGQLSMLDRALAQTDARLVVIDPIMAFLDQSVVVGCDQSVRRALLPLSCLAAKHRCAVLLVRHLNKKPGGQAVYRGAGTMGFLAACRSAFLIARDPHLPQRFVLAEQKNNLAEAQPSLAYTLEAKGNALPVVCWLGESEYNANQLLIASAHQPLDFSPRDRARDFLLAHLEEGPRTSRELWALAKEQGLSERTLNRAKRELTIRSVRVKVEGTMRSYWLLPHQQLPDTTPPEAAPPDLEEWLAPLRAQFPPSTPLDDL
jgi:hypothetical protein